MSKDYSVPIFCRAVGSVIVGEGKDACAWPREPIYEE